MAKNKKTFNRLLKTPYIIGRDWQRTNVGGKTSPCDLAYAKIADDIFKAIAPFASLMPQDYYDVDAMSLAIKLTGYLEDVVSGLGIFKAFRTLNTRLYGKKLPFYGLGEDYDDNDINPEDVRYLIWHEFAEFMIDDGQVINPENPAIQELSEIAYKLLEDAFDRAPENTCKRKSLVEPAIGDDVMVAKFRLMWILESCYLTSSAITMGSLMDETDKLADKMGISDSMASYIVTSDASVRRKVRPLALTPAQWLATILRELGEPDLATAVESIKKCDCRIFRTTGHDDTYLYLEGIDGEKYDVLIDSLAPANRKQLLESPVLITNITSFNGKWNVNGMASAFNNTPESEKIYTDARKKRLDEQKLEHDSFNSFLRRTDGRRILYASSLTELQRQLGYDQEIPITHSPGEDTDTNAPLMAYISDNGQLGMTFKLVSGVADPANPFYTPQNAADNAFEIIFNDEAVAPDCLAYLQGNGFLRNAALNPIHGAEHGHKLLQDNLDFFIRFYRTQTYLPPTAPTR